MDSQQLVSVVFESQAPAKGSAKGPGKGPAKGPAKGKGKSGDEAKATDAAVGTEEKEAKQVKFAEVQPAEASSAS